MAKSTPESLEPLYHGAILEIPCPCGHYSKQRISLANSPRWRQPADCLPTCKYKDAIDALLKDIAERLQQFDTMIAKRA